MYSQAKVIAGGLAHIPVVIAVFYFILTTFNKRALKFVEEAKTKKPEKKNNFIKLFRSQNVTIFVKSLQIKLQIDNLL